MTKRALIIGGSLGGLFTATILRRIGWEVEVFERSPHALDSRGGGIVLQESVEQAFDFAGIALDGTIGVPSGDRIYLDAEDRVVRRWHMPQMQTSWGLLYEALRSAVPDRYVHAGRTLVDVEQDDHQVVAHFANGERASADVLIAADGPGSTVRQLLLPESTIRYAGYVAWRGLVAEPALPSPMSDRLRETFAFQQGTRHLFLEYMVPGEDRSCAPGERRWNWVWHFPVRSMEHLGRLLTDVHGVRHHFSIPPGLLSDTSAADLHREALSQLAPTFRALVQATPDPFLQAIVDVSVPQMVFGRVVLLGDAASVLRPHTASGTAKAAADALALGRLLDVGKGPSLFDALAVWEEDRLREAERLTQWGIQLGNSIVGTSGPSRELVMP